MDGTARNLTVGLISCLLGMGAGGCINRSSLPSWLPFAVKPDHLPGVTPPSERIAHLKQLAQKVSAADAAEKARLAQELVNDLRKEEDPILRAELLRALAACGGAEADAVLRAALNDPDADVRTIACTIWGKRGGAEAAQQLGKVLGSDIDKDVRMAAARALGESRDPAAIAPLGNALEDPSPAMQHLAVVSLRQVTGKDLGNDVEQWRAYVKNGSPPPAPSPSLAERLRRWIQ